MSATAARHAAGRAAVRRPLSDAVTTYMAELHHTVPFARVVADATCAFCGIRLVAIPDAPVRYQRPRFPVADYYHPGCAKAQRISDGLM